MGWVYVLGWFRVRFSLMGFSLIFTTGVSAAICHLEAFGYRSEPTTQQPLLSSFVGHALLHLQSTLSFLFFASASPIPSTAVET